MEDDWQHCWWKMMINIVDGICQKVFFLEFPLDCSSREHNRHHYHRQMELIYLHNICLECIHTTTMDAFITSFPKGFCLSPCEHKAPSSRETQLHKEEVTKLFTPIHDWNTESTCPAQHRHWVQLYFSDRERWQEDAGKKKICVPFHHSSLTYILFG